MANEPKKKILLVASVVCFMAAVTILAVWLWPKNTYEGLENESFSIMCRNSTCNETWQMNAKTFLEYQKKNSNPQDPMHPALAVCPKCGEKTGDIACKCPKCGTVFFEATTVTENDEYPDRCPECKYSANEEQREAARASRN